MQFESLPNEFFFDLFEYFDAVSQLRAFSGLNSRFDTLLYKHFRAYHLDLRRISKRDFDILCQQHLRLITDHIVSFHLADEEEIPGLLELFLSRGFNLDQFINLKSVTLEKIYSTNITRVLGELKSLIHLNITRYDMRSDQEGVSYLINKFWNLPKLTHCKLDRCYSSEIYFNENTQISSTLEHLSICLLEHRLTIKNLVHIFLHTPCLRVLSVYVQLVNENEKFPTVITSITTLNILFSGDVRVLSSLFQNMPCLRHLTIGMQTSNLNGHEWKQIIVNHLPKLEVFQFQMAIVPPNVAITEQRVDELFNTFQTPFWLHEHQWYVRCDWENKSVGPINYGCIYTLPYAFDSFFETAVGIRRSKWTCPDNTKFWSFNRVHTFDTTKKLHFKKSTNDRLYLRPAYFPNIHKLKTEVPLLDTTWCIIPTLDYLTTLSVNIVNQYSSSEFQALLDRALQLYTLIVHFLNVQSYMNVLFEVASPSIRRLHINPKARQQFCAFDDLQCTAFAKCSLACQCEVLEIRVQSLDSVMNLVNSMNNIRTMKIHVPEYPQIERDQVKIKLIEWVQNHLPAECWLSDDEHFGISFIIRLWCG